MVHQVAADFLGRLQDHLHRHGAGSDNAPEGRRGQRELQGARLCQFQVLAFQFPPRQIARGFQFPLGFAQRRVDRLQPPVEQHLLFLKQRHVVGFLLDPARRVALGRDVQQQQPGTPPIAMKVQIGRNVSGHFH